MRRRSAQLAPDLALRDQHGQEQTLAARRGVRNVLLVFYPFAFTGVCTGELRALSDHAAAWDDLGTDVIAVSCDPRSVVAGLRRAGEARVPAGLRLLAARQRCRRRTTRSTRRWAARGRATFVIDRTGVIRWAVRTAIPDARDVTDYLKALDAL